jgi:putative two-component system response regulator
MGAIGNMLDKRPTILVVDDSIINIKILTSVLEEEYQILTAGNGVEALEILGDAVPLPKLILLDVVMPKMSGIEMYELLKSNEKLKRIPVIFITAHNDSEEGLLSAGAVDFINKPFKREIVKLRVRNQMALKNYSDNLEAMVLDKTAEVTQILNNSLQSIASAIEDRDPESGEHVKRTQLYVKALTDYLIESESIYADELIELQPRMIMKAMALHDVGKLSIPDKILLKPGKLDDEEYEIMKTHTTKGRKIIGKFGHIGTSLYLRHCADIAYCHHERWDGKGYPRQLKGQEIPLVARLASLADVYDALISVRVYKAAIPHEQALEIIASGCGTQFDPVATDAVLSIHDQFSKIAKKYQ